MRLNKMYNIEKIIIECRYHGIMMDTKKILRICKLSKIHISKIDELNYIKAAIAIPYEEMYDYINNSDKSLLEILNELSEKYSEFGITPALAENRFHGVTRLSKSILYGENLANFYGINKPNKLGK